LLEVLVALAIAGLPPLRLYASWAVAFPFAWAAQAAGFAVRFVCSTSASERTKESLLRYAAATTCSGWRS
jgi:hypothetical protein